MSFLDRIFGPKTDPEKAKMMPLYDRVVAKAREERWYKAGQVPDNLDGRFEMVAAMLSLLLIRLEQEDGNSEMGVYLTEIFVDDMDGQLREIGIGDMIVGKHIGKMMSVLGGRLTAYRDSMHDMAALRDAIARNIFAGDADCDTESLDYLAGAFIAEKKALDEATPKLLISGNSPW